MSEEIQVEPVSQDDKINDLINELTASRGNLKKYVINLDAISTKVESLFPTGTDFRNKWVLEEKIKATSALYSTILGYTQEINKTIMNEIDARRKAQSNETDGEIDVRSLAAAIEEHNKTNKK